MKRLTLIVLGMLVYFMASSQSTPIYTENFDSYPSGAGVALLNPTWWTTWNNLPGTSEDGVVSIMQFSTAMHSVWVSDIPGLTDLVLKLGDRMTGKYDLNWKMYFEPGRGGHFNIQHFEALGTEWAYQVWFNGDGTGILEAGGVTFPFNFPHGGWFVVQNIIDLDQDLVRLFISGSLVHQWPFSYQSGIPSGTNQLGGVDFYSSALDASPPQYYIDDVNFFQFQSYPSYADDFESYLTGGRIAVYNPVWWKTWSYLPNTHQDGQVVEGAASSGTRMLYVYGYGQDIVDAVLKLGERTSGKYVLGWKMKIGSASGGYYNIQHHEACGYEYAFEAWFYANGDGLIRTANVNYPFTYPKNAWFPVVHLIDLDNDQISLFVNGIHVHQWPFSYQVSSTSGTCQLGGVDFYGATPDGSSPMYFIDDVTFRPGNFASIPLANWPVYLAVGLMVALSLYFFWRRR